MVPAIFLTVLLAVQQTPVIQKIDLHWVFVNDNLVWESPPKELRKTYVLAENAVLVILYPTGSFAEVSCTLFGDRKSGRLSICRGCGFSISKGTWTRNADNSFWVKFRLVYRPVLIENRPLPESEVEQRWVPRGRSEGRIAAVVQAPAGKYIPLSNLYNLDFLSNIIASEGGDQK